jgi:hypothetical protein
MAITFYSTKQVATFCNLFKLPEDFVSRFDAMSMSVELGYATPACLFPTLLSIRCPKTWKTNILGEIYPSGDMIRKNFVIPEELLPFFASEKKLVTGIQTVNDYLGVLTFVFGLSEWAYSYWYSNSVDKVKNQAVGFKLFDSIEFGTAIGNAILYNWKTCLEGFKEAGMGEVLLVQIHPVPTDLEELVGFVTTHKVEGEDAMSIVGVSTMEIDQNDPAILPQGTVQNDVEEMSLEEIGVVEPVKLSTATKLLQPVKGTDEKSKYFFVLQLGPMKFGLRLKVTGFSFRVEREGDDWFSPSEIARLQDAGFVVHPNSHCSVHAKPLDGKSLVQTAQMLLGAIVFAFPEYEARVTKKLDKINGLGV